MAWRSSMVLLARFPVGAQLKCSPLGDYFGGRYCFLSFVSLSTTVSLCRRGAVVGFGVYSVYLTMVSRAYKLAPFRGSTLSDVLQDLSA